MAQQYGSSSGFTVQMEGPFSSSGTSVKMVDINILVDAWKGGESPYSQVVEVSAASVNSRVDLYPSADQIIMMRDQCFAMTAENNEGIVTVYAIGDKPENDMVIQAAITEVVA